jgi:hypothetical protein
VRFLQQLLFLLKRLLFDGSFAVVQANIAAAVVSAVGDTDVSSGIFLSQLPTVFSPVSHFCLQTKSLDNGSTYTVHVQYHAEVRGVKKHRSLGAL